MDKPTEGMLEYEVQEAVLKPKGYQLLTIIDPDGKYITEVYNHGEKVEKGQKILGKLRESQSDGVNPKTFINFDHAKDLAARQDKPRGGGGSGYSKPMPPKHIQVAMAIAPGILQGATQANMTEKLECLQLAVTFILKELTE